MFASLIAVCLSITGQADANVDPVPGNAFYTPKVGERAVLHFPSKEASTKGIKCWTNMADLMAFAEENSRLGVLYRMPFFTGETRASETAATKAKAEKFVAATEAVFSKYEESRAVIYVKDMTPVVVVGLAQCLKRPANDGYLNIEFNGLAPVDMIMVKVLEGEQKGKILYVTSIGERNVRVPNAPAFNPIEPAGGDGNMPGSQPASNLGRRRSAMSGPALQPGNFQYQEKYIVPNNLGMQNNFGGLGTGTVASFVASKSGKVYHLATCPSVAKIKFENRVVFGSATEAEQRGYHLATDCHR